MICATRNEAHGFRGESWAEGRKRREDGADDRVPTQLLGSLRGPSGRAQSPRRSRIRRRCGNWVPLRGDYPRRCSSDEGRDLSPPNLLSNGIEFT